MTYMTWAPRTHGLAFASVTLYTNVYGAVHVKGVHDTGVEDVNVYDTNVYGVV